jgi:hypothetical protein
VRWRQVVLLYVVCAALAAEYWLIEHRREVALEGRPRRRFLAVRLDDLREIRLLREGRAVVSRRDEGRWAVVEPADAAIPSDLIAAFTEALVAAEQIDRVGGAEVDAATYGLGPEAARVEIVAGRDEPLVITLGGTNPTGTAVYARRAGAAEVVLIGRNVRYYEDLIFQALPARRVPVVEEGHPVGG